MERLGRHEERADGPQKTRGKRKETRSTEKHHDSKTARLPNNKTARATQTNGQLSITRLCKSSPFIPTRYKGQRWEAATVTKVRLCRFPFVATLAPFALSAPSKQVPNHLGKREALAPSLPLQTSPQLAAFLAPMSTNRPFRAQPVVYFILRRARLWRSRERDASYEDTVSHSAYHSPCLQKKWATNRFS